MEILLIALAVVVLLAVLPVYPYSRRWGYSPFAGVVLAVVLVLLVWLFLSTGGNGAEEPLLVE